MTNREFVARVLKIDPPIQGYEGTEKSDWLRTGKRILNALARELRLAPGTFKVRVNPAGPAVSGDVVLHGDWLYIDLSQGSMGMFMWRLCDGQKDYTGKTNQWAPWSALLELPALAAHILRHKEIWHGPA